MDNETASEMIIAIYWRQLVDIDQLFTPSEFVKRFYKYKYDSLDVIRTSQNILISKFELISVLAEKCKAYENYLKNPEPAKELEEYTLEEVLKILQEFFNLAKEIDREIFGNTAIVEKVFKK